MPRVRAPGPGWPGFEHPPGPWTEPGHELDPDRRGYCVCGSRLVHRPVNGLSCEAYGGSMLVDRDLPDPQGRLV